MNDGSRPDPLRDTARRQDRRDGRHADRALLWSESKLPRVRSCGRDPVGNSAVAVKVTHGAGGPVAGFSGLETCGSVWACPVCAAKVAATRTEHLTQVLETWTGKGGGVVMVTLTMRHHGAQRLSDLWDGLARGWDRVTNSRGWRDDRARFGVAGYSRHLECTYGAPSEGGAGWHLHAHVLLYTDAPLGADALAHLGSSMFSRWRAGLVAAGLDAPLENSGGLDVRAVTSVADLGAYLTKQADPTAIKGTALEVTRADLKQARGGNRSPWEVLRYFRETGDVAALDAWHEWEAASQGRRQLTWSRGFLAALNLTDNRTDEELAAEDHGGEVLGLIEAKSWRALVKAYPHAPAGLLRAAETGGRDALAALLASYGLVLDWPPGEEMTAPPVLAA